MLKIILFYFILLYFSISPCFSVNPEAVLAYIILPKGASNEALKIMKSSALCFCVFFKQGHSRSSYRVNDINTLEKAKNFFSDESVQDCFTKKIIIVKKEDGHYNPRSSEKAEDYPAREMLCTLYPLSKDGCITYSSILKYNFSKSKDQQSEASNAKNNSDVMIDRPQGGEFPSKSEGGKFTGASLESITSYLSLKDERQPKEPVNNRNGTCLLNPRADYKGTQVKQLTSSIATITGSEDTPSSSCFVKQGKVTSFKFNE